MDKSIPTKLYEAGLSIMAVREDKLPYGKWEHLQHERIKPNGEFENADAVAVVCGDISGGLEVLDFDTKYDVSGTLMQDFKRRLNDSQLLHKVVIQQSVSGGYHILYRCDKIEGNQKLAQRNATEIEKLKNPHEKVKVLIETRGSGGYVLVSPSKGYEVKSGDLYSIPRITEDERRRILDCARSFNQVYQQHYSSGQNIVLESGERPGDDYNTRGDILPTLEQYGWQVSGREKGDSLLLRRPGKSFSHSASYSQSLKTFYVFSSSTEFDPGKAYSNFQVYAKLVHNDDYQAAARDLLNRGYGREKSKYKPIGATIRKVEAHELKAVINQDDVDKYISAVRGKTMKMGLETGIPTLDKHFLFKRGNLVIINGHENTGKSNVMWYLMLMATLRHQWKWIVCTMENSKGYFYRRMIEFMNNKPIEDISADDMQISKSLIDEKFIVFDNKNSYSVFDILSYAEEAIRQYGKIDGILFDPYNSFDFPDGASKHDYDYKVLNAIAGFKKRHDCAVLINCHAYTFAARKKENGYISAPDRADTEGGVKFAAKADDFLTIHRLTNHETDWMITEIHVRKIKELETGGMPTFKDRPVKLKMLPGKCGFTDANGYNPMTGTTDIFNKIQDREDS